MKLLLFFAIFSNMFLWQQPAAAVGQLETGGVGQLETSGIERKLPNPLGSQEMTIGDIPSIVGRIISAVLSVLGAVALLVVIYGGFLWLTSAGNEQRVAKGRLTLMWATIAIGIIFMSWMLVAFFFQALGV